MATGNDIYQKALTHLGESGYPTWEAYNEWGTGWHWCVAFVWRVFQECNASNLFYAGGKTAYVPTEDEWFYQNCEWVTYDNAQAGDVVIFTWSPTGAGNTRSGSRDHTGIFEGRISSTQFSCVEGNTGSDNPYSSSVKIRTRNRSNIFAIYRPNYSAQEEKTKRCIQASWNATDSQKWKLEETTDGYVKIVNKRGTVLDVKNGTTKAIENGTYVQAWTDNGTDAQKWKLVENEVGGYFIVSKANEEYALDVYHSTINARAYMQMHKIQENYDYKWAEAFEIQKCPDDEEWSRIVNLKSLFCLDSNPTGIEL